ncbi:unnamed protein product [Adineta ricciae]|uniref:Uncharacterized protein n=1 Tax=Adineta ricciae TaxID=249248 RepID=A0A813QIX8_ADIRI|nr:unnamed protein product [Adineta ricciae]CAF1283756.1 unnamed protein product [Adineta ricciae]
MCLTIFIYASFVASPHNILSFALPSQATVIPTTTTTTISSSTSTSTSTSPSTSKKPTCIPFTIPDSRPFFDQEQSQLNLPPKLPNSSYEQVVQQLRSLRLIVVGCARNVGANVDNYRTHVDQIVDLFHPSSRVLIFESDSTDNTVVKLQNWTRAEVFSQGKLVPQIASRTDRLALCRNTLLTKAYNYTPDYILATDVDMFSTTVPSFLSNFYYNRDDWSVMTASITGGYYDIWALRTLSDNVMNYDVWHRIWHLHNNRKKYCNNDFVDLIILIHKKQIPVERDLIEVRSAFGGAGLYKVNSTYGCRYDGSRTTCEHVPFHLCMREKNRARIFINPRFLLR